MKKRFVYWSLLFLVVACNDKNLVTQTISCPSDCLYCAPAWSWNGGVATVGDVMYYTGDGSEVFPQFNFKSTVSGDLSFYYKINDDYLGYINVYGAVRFMDDEEGPCEWTLVKAGHVDVGKKIIVEGRECAIKDIKIVGSVEDNNQKDNNPSQWDF